MTSRVVSVRGDCDVDLENGDFLCATDLVKVIPRLGDAEKSSFRPFDEYVFVVSEWDASEVSLPLPPYPAAALCALCAFYFICMHR
jgi:hypothetical protein